MGHRTRRSMTVVVIPVAAIPTLSALLTTETRPRPVRGDQDAEFVSWRFDSPRAEHASTDPSRRPLAAERPSPAMPRPKRG